VDAQIIGIKRNARRGLWSIFAHVFGVVNALQRRKQPSSKGCVIPKRRHRPGRTVHLIMVMSVSLLAWFIAVPPSVRADAPGTRGDEPQPQGSVGSSMSWERVTPLAPLGAAPPLFAPGTAGVVASTVMPEPAWYGAQQTTQSSAIPWLGRMLNPGNWILDAGLGIVAAILNMGNEWLLAWLHVFLGELSTPEAAPALTCTESAAMAYIVCTKPSLIFGSNAGQGSALNPLGSAIAARLQTIWAGLRPAAIGLITLLFTARLGRMLLDGQRSLTTEGRSLLLTFAVALIGIQATAWPLRWLFEFFYALNNAVLTGMDAAIGKRIWIPILSGPVTGGASVQLAQIMGVFVVLIPLTFLVTIAVIRLVKMVVLVTIAPLAAATLCHPATAGFFRRWLERLVDLLLQQTMWAIAFALGLAVVDMLPHVSLEAPTTDPALGMVVQSLYAFIVLLLVLLSRQLFDNLIAAGATGAAVGVLTRRWAMAAAPTPFAARGRPSMTSGATSGSNANASTAPASAAAAPNRGGRARGSGGPSGNASPVAGTGATPGARAAAAIRQPIPPAATGPTQALRTTAAATGPTQPLRPNAPTGPTVPPVPAPAPLVGSTNAAAPAPQRPTSIRTTLRGRTNGSTASGSSGSSSPNQPKP